ncbi:MAG: hypothetical protein G8237_04965 [Magnetococcales bacterium]|nr:hypothetical protein [Magnetococcales bacterium]NGZ05687.1 hypothetical protein [Magnetococcales bacterium]
MDISWPTESGVEPVRAAKGRSRPVRQEEQATPTTERGGNSRRDRVSLSGAAAPGERFVVPVLFSHHALVEKKIDAMVDDAMSAMLHQPVDLPEDNGVQPRMVWVASS